MDFSKLKLVTEALGNDLYSRSAQNSAQNAAPGSGQQQAASQSMQNKQKTSVVAPSTRARTTEPVVTSARPPASTNVVKTSVGEQFSELRRRKETFKALEEKKADWRSELSEALGVADDPDHPYVDVMPFKNSKMKDVEKLAKQEAMKKKAAENPAQMMAKAAGMANIGEETKAERGMSALEKTERRNKRDEDEDYGAEARRKFRQLALRGKKKRPATGHKLGEEVLAEDSKSGDERGKKTKDNKNDAKMRREAGKRKAADKKAKANQERILNKAESDYRNSNAKADSHAQRAQTANQRAQQAKARGDHKQAAKHYETARHHAIKAKDYRTYVARKYIPVGSHVYAKKGQPLQMNTKFHSDSRSAKGRKNIIKRTFGINDED